MSAVAHVTVLVTVGRTTVGQDMKGQGDNYKVAFTAAITGAQELIGQHLAAVDSLRAEGPRNIDG